MPVCLNHPNTDSVAFCVACRKPLCRECVVKIENKTVCSEECYYKFVSASKRSATIIKEINESKRKSQKQIVIFWAVLLQILGISTAIWFWFAPNKSEMEKEWNSISREMEKSGEKFKDAVGDMIPDSSKYKNQREGWLN